MKKILLIFTMILTSCGYNKYSCNYSDLYSVAINSLLWINGYSWKTDFKCNPSIEIIDHDSYGRTIFTYYEKYYKGFDMSFSSLIVCQDSNEKEVFYYEDINYIVKEQVLYSHNIEKFSDIEIEYLKLINDWNKEINYKKCVRKEITNSKPKILGEKKLEKQISETFELANGEYSLFMDFLTTNSNNSMYLIYGYIRKTEEEKIYFVGLVEKNDVLKLSTIVLSNVYNYTTEFVEFKRLNNWY